MSEFGPTNRGGHLLQYVRAVDSLTEGSWHIHVDPGLAERLKDLLCDAHTGTIGGSERALINVSIDHATPLTRIGSHAAPLVFSRAMARRCRDLWSDTRAGTVFSGLITPKRRRAFRRWERRHQNVQYAVTDNRSHDLTSRITESTRGRTWETKGWDEPYFRELAGARYALCPSGDHTWSYRFFEAALCGAIPIIEAPVPAYGGFVFGRMDDPGLIPAWSLQIAHHNAELAEKRLTIPAHRLDAIIDQAVAHE